ncbi:MAG: hypothetical protein K6F95_01480 [Selenomonas sp.]|uniref:O-linked N-acetylglucosamine transferase, SPINDLY family protein n=1 Tax=Selenomonas sp. TaxID=2053611 RepID=UPI0025CB7E98|nr:hypothetical protein [Selenomonas sp.]MCR5756564.1 hypothetical protein [Selenomonas sp.]
MEHDTLNWLNLADKFASDGDPKGMRACARELWNIDAESMDGAAVMAEAALYTGDHEEAHALLDEILRKKPQHLRGRLVAAGLAAVEFRLEAEILELNKLIDELERKLWALTPDEPYYKIVLYLLQKARGWLADAYYLGAQPDRAAALLLAYSKNAATDEEKAASYSKFLFMRNYRELGALEGKALAAKYGPLLAATPYLHENVQKLPEKKLRIGYISPDFRQHAVSNFVAPLLKHFDGRRFSVYAYSTGPRDGVTKRLMASPVTWRDLRGRSPRTAARLIAEDQIDILVDLSGHSNNNCLPIMALRPAPVQVAGIGYMNTTGLSTVDYFLSDEVCLPTGDMAAQGFTEKILRLPHSHLCYMPGAVREIPSAGTEAPCLKNGFVTFGSFNNLAKVTDETLLLWRGILDQVRSSKLVLKGKICSIDSGKAILRERLKRLNFDLSKVEMRPYSPDYMEQYRDIDIALDTMPYNGGLTTCEALFMGVPVVSIRGRRHGSRFGASILVNAGVKELVVENDINYVRRAVQLGNSPELIGAYHSGLRANLLQSPLMDVKIYMQELESGYCKIWRNFCTI